MTENSQTDDIFDEEVSEVSIGSRDWEKTSKELANVGFREGISRGENDKLQEGFNQGYSTASDLTFQIAQLRGEMSAAITILHLQKNTRYKDKLSILENLIEETADLEKDVLKGGSVARQHIENYSQQIKSKPSDSQNPTLSKSENVSVASDLLGDLDLKDASTSREKGEITISCDSDNCCKNRSAVCQETGKQIVTEKPFFAQLQSIKERFKEIVT